MKKIIIFTIVICFSCQEKQITKPCTEIEKKYDSLVNLRKKEKDAPFIKFYSILGDEKGTQQDSILIDRYKNLIGHDSLIDLYIWDRIHTINQNTIKSDVYKTFKGTYLLKPNHNKKYAQATKVVIDNDSCYLYKYSDLIIKDKFKLINSSDQYIKGKINLKRYKIRLLDFSSKVVLIDDNGCMDCEQLQFYQNKN